MSNVYYVMGFAVGALVIFSVAQPSCGILPTLDQAQDAFEHGATRWPQPSDFEMWRGRNELKCRDFKGLRTCEVIWLNEGVRDRMTFACSTEQCVWVDP